MANKNYSAKDKQINSRRKLRNSNAYAGNGGICHKMKKIDIYG